MNSLVYIFRFLYRVRYWITICPIIAALLVYISTRNSSHSYEVRSTIYTGVMSGYSIESEGSDKQDWNSLNNAMDNLINIITAQTTLKNVSTRLYTQHMMQGDDRHDNNYITSKNFRAIRDKTPRDVRALIDENSEEQTIEYLKNYEKASSTNFIYGLFNWTHRHYSYAALSKITVRRMGNSDMLDIRYVADDPGIAYNTLVLLNDEFIKQYEDLRFGETNSVIKYFEEELAKMAILLRNSEDSLTHYNVEKRVINYSEQTKYVAALTRDFALKYEDILLAHKGSESLIAQMELQLSEQTKALRNNALFMNKLNLISDLTSRITRIETFKNDTLAGNITDQVAQMRTDLAIAEIDLENITKKMSEQQFTKEGIASSSIVENWLLELMRFEKAKAELMVMEQRKIELDAQFAYFSPIGSTIKRKEREISFTESSYLAILNSLNAARLRQKNLQMTSATLKIINPPTYPLSPMLSSNRLKAAFGFFGTMLFLIGCFIIIELLDRTLRDKIRAERITSGKVLGALPITSRFTYRAYNQQWMETATQYMSNSLVGYLKPNYLNVINILSNEPAEGKSFIANHLYDNWTAVGLKVKLVNTENDFNIEDKKFYMASSIADLCDCKEFDVVIVEYPALNSCSIPKALLSEASVNLLIARANRGWKDTDQLLYNKLKFNIGSSPLFIYLTKAEQLVVENFTGLLPPFTFFRRFAYRIYQFGLTSSDR